MSTLEPSLRGGAIALLLLLAILLLRDARHVPAARFATLYALGVAAYVVVSAAAFIGDPPLWLLPFRIVGAANPVIFWLLAATLFNDEFTATRRDGIIWIAMASVGVVCWFVSDALVHLGATALSLAFNVVALWYAVAGRSGDLIESRRKLRTAFIAAAALYSIAQISAEFIVTGGPGRTALESINAAGMIAITFIFCLELLAVRRQGSIISLAMPKRSPAATVAVGPTGAIDDSAKQDEVWLAALKRIMENDKIYREEALSVAALADKLGLPDYRLRRIINQQLGYRNFTAFLNDYRLADVMTALSDSQQVSTPILTIALSAGFQSIGPFNRAFKAHTGVTPTEFRQEQIAKAERRSAA